MSITNAPLPELQNLSIKEITKIINHDWQNVYFGAKPYLSAMLTLDSINDDYGLDSGKDIVTRFLSNSGQWHGDIAKTVKQELKRRLQ